MRTRVVSGYEAVVIESHRVVEPER
jgi:hypothetical protein